MLGSLVFQKEGGEAMSVIHPDFFTTYPWVKFDFNNPILNS